MNVFHYDRSFEGLLSAVFDAYTERLFPDALLTPEDVPPLLTERAHTVITGADKAGRVFRGLEKRLSPQARKALMLAWLSEQPGSDSLLFRYMRKVFDSSGPVEQDYADNDVFAVRQLAEKVSAEQHLLIGFARFQKTADGLYFSAVSPKYNVLPLMLPHFADRFSDQQWILYDAARGYGALFDGEGFQDVTLNQGSLRDGRLQEALLAEDEALFQELWKSYFKAMTIKERLNPALQRRCMPRRYWAYLTEKQQ